jgi:N-acetyl-anhydromuramyl-L-alanine amidase AmpD
VIPSPNHESRNGAKVRLIVIHTAEGARTVASLGAYFARSATQASSHAGIDDHSIETYVDYDRAAWTVRSGNHVSDNAELCGFAAWTRDEWLNQHRPMLELAAGWIADRCTARGIPVVKLTPDQVAAGQPGVCGHVDWTIGMRDGSHTDPGPGFPWDVVIDLAARCAAPSPAEVLTAHGIVNADIAVHAAQLEGLDLAAAAACLEKESHGRNVWGHDQVDTGGLYVKGDPVTQDAYLAYRDAVHTGRIKRQGVGPCQCTSAGYQDTADQLGGCWLPLPNMRSGFRGLAALIARYGVREGARHYNGLGRGDAYADDFTAKYQVWQTRLAGATTGEPDMDVRQDAMLTAIYQQMAGPDTDIMVDGKQWLGWPTWGGGTDERLTLVDLNRRTNVEVRQSWLEVKALREDVEALKAAGGPTPGGGLSDADVERIAEALAGKLSGRLAE